MSEKYYNLNQLFKHYRNQLKNENYQVFGVLERFRQWYTEFSNFEIELLDRQYFTKEDRIAYWQRKLEQFFKHHTNRSINKIKDNLKNKYDWDGEYEAWSDKHIFPPNYNQKLAFSNKTLSKAEWYNSILYLINRSRTEYENYSSNHQYHHDWEKDKTDLVLIIQYDYLRKVKQLFICTIKLRNTGGIKQTPFKGFSPPAKISPSSISLTSSLSNRKQIHRNRFALMIFLIYVINGFKIRFELGDNGKERLEEILISIIQNGKIPDDLEYDISYITNSFNCQPFGGAAPNKSIKALLNKSKPFSLSKNIRTWKQSSDRVLKEIKKDFKDYTDYGKISKEIDKISNLQLKYPVWIN